MWKCSKCGVMNSNWLACRYCHAVAPADAQPPGVSGWSAGEWYRFLRCMVGCLGCVIVGVVLIANPTFWANPKSISVRDILAGALPILIGIVFLIVAVLSLLTNRKK